MNSGSLLLLHEHGVDSKHVALTRLEVRVSLTFRQAVFSFFRIKWYWETLSNITHYKHNVQRIESMCFLKHY